MLIKFNLILALLFAAVSGTYLGDEAAKMAPGTWKLLNTQNWGQSMLNCGNDHGERGAVPCGSENAGRNTRFYKIFNVISLPKIVRS